MTWQNQLLAIKRQSIFEHFWIRHAILPSQ